MIKHIVMWRLADFPDKEERAKAIKENLEALKGKIDEIVDIEVGINLEDSQYSSDVVLTATFENAEDLNTYRMHPAHKAVGAAYVKPYVSERRVADYEV